LRPLFSIDSSADLEAKTKLRTKKREKDSRVKWNGKSQNSNEVLKAKKKKDKKKEEKKNEFKKNFIQKCTYCLRNSVVERLNPVLIHIEPFLSCDSSLKMMSST